MGFLLLAQYLIAQQAEYLLAVTAGDYEMHIDEDYDICLN